MAKSGGAVSTGAATRLVHVIGVVRWAVLALIGIGVGISVLATLSGDRVVGTIGAMGVVYGLVAALGTYIWLGWLQQTLLMLVGIAKNTARSDIDILSRL